MFPNYHFLRYYDVRLVGYTSNTSNNRFPMRGSHMRSNSYKFFLWHL